MRTAAALVLFTALTLSAAGQPPKADPKAPPKADAKMDPKAPAKADAKMAPKADTNAQPAANWPSQVAGKTLDQWIKEMEDPDPSHRAMAIDMVLQFGPNAKKAIPTLIRQVKNSPDVAPKAHAMYALEQLVPLDLQTYARDAVDALCGVGGLDSNQGTLRIRACRALAAIGIPARAAVPKL